MNIFEDEELLTRYLERNGPQPKRNNLEKTSLQAFAKYLKQNGISEPAELDIEEYKLSLIKKGSSPFTVRNYLYIVKRYFTFAQREGVISGNPAAPVSQVHCKQKSAKTEILTHRQALDLLYHAKEQAEQARTIYGLRNYAIIALVSDGARICDIMRANVGDIADIKGQKTLYMRTGKSNVFVPLSQLSIDALANYLRYRVDGADPSAVLFASESTKNRGGRMNQDAFGRVIRSELKACGLKGEHITADSLRCAFLREDHLD